MGEKIGKIDNSHFFDGELDDKGVASRHNQLEPAVTEAKRIAASAEADAAVCASEDGYDVVKVSEISSLARAGHGNQLHSASEKVVGVFAGDASGVSLRPTKDRSTRFDKLAATLQRGGLSTEQARELVQHGVSAARCEELLTRLLSQGPAALADYGPRVTLVRAFAELQSSGRSWSASALLEYVERLGRAVVLRPDGYLVRLPNGEALKKVGDLRVSENGLEAGPYLVGQAYIEKAGVMFAADGQLRAVGAPIDELGAEEALWGRAIAGIGLALAQSVEGISQLVRHPIRTIADLRYLPRAVAILIESSPEYWERFRAMPAGDQVEEASRLLTHVALTVGGGVGIAKSVARAGSTLGKLPVMPTLSMTRDGALAYSMVTVDAGAVATALSGGPGSLYVLHMAGSRLPDPDAVAANQKKWQGHLQSKYGKKLGRTDEAAPAPEGLPKSAKTADAVRSWLKKAGFERKGQVGSHEQWVGPNGHKVTVPRHGGDIKKGTLSAIRRQIAHALGGVAP